MCIACRVLAGIVIANVMMRMRWIIFIIVVCLSRVSLAAHPAISEAALLNDMLARVPVAVQQAVSRIMPPLALLHDAALHAARISPHLPVRWAHRARWAAALPRVQAGVRSGLRANNNLKLQDNVSVSSAGVVIGPQSSDFTQFTNSATILDVRAIWSLNELVFSPDSILVSREARARRDETRTIFHLVDDALFAWQQWEMLARTPKRPHVDLPALACRTRADRAAAELDALTDGWFSRTIHLEDPHATPLP